MLFCSDFLPQFMLEVNGRYNCQNDFPIIFSLRSLKFCPSFVAGLKQFYFVFLRSASRIILQSVETGLITQKQLNLCL